MANLLAQAGGINPNNYNFSSVCIYTPTGAYVSNQEFMSGGATPAPIPPSFLLLATGLLALALLGYGKKAGILREDRK